LNCGEEKGQGIGGYEGWRETGLAGPVAAATPHSPSQTVQVVVSAEVVDWARFLVWKWLGLFLFEH